MGPDTGVPGLSHGHTQARTQGSWLHASVPLVSTGCGQGRRGAWYTREAKILAPFIMVPLLSHRMWAGVRGAWYTVGTSGRLSGSPWRGRGTGYVQETTGEGCCWELTIGEAMDRPN